MQGDRDHPLHIVAAPVGMHPAHAAERAALSAHRGGEWRGEVSRLEAARDHHLRRSWEIMGDHHLRRSWETTGDHLLRRSWEIMGDHGRSSPEEQSGRNRKESGGIRRVRHSSDASIAAARNSPPPWSERALPTTRCRCERGRQPMKGKGGNQKQSEATRSHQKRI